MGGVPWAAIHNVFSRLYTVAFFFIFLACKKAANEIEENKGKGDENRELKRWRKKKSQNKSLPCTGMPNRESHMLKS